MIEDAFPVVPIAVEGAAEIKPVMIVARTGLIHELKQKIKDVLGIDVNRQTLWLGDQELEDTMSIECIITNNDSGSVRLSVTSQPIGTFSVCVKPQGPTQYTETTLEFPAEGQQFEVKESETVLELKGKIVARLNNKMEKKKSTEVSFGTGDITLYRLGLWNMHDAHTLSQYYVDRFCTIGLRVAQK